MVVEHQFITTLDGPVALAAAQAFLHSVGFQDDGAGDGFVQARRGTKKMPGSFGIGWQYRTGVLGDRVPDIRKLPQTVRVEFDRGRVSVAASLINMAKEKEVEKQMLTAAVSGVEAILAGHQELADARRAWDEADDQIAAEVRRLKRRRRIFLGVVLGVFLLFFALVIIGIAQGH